MSEPIHISTPIKWTICAMASLGFLFDIYEVLVAPLVLQPAVMELGGFAPGTPDYRYWTGLLFWIPPLVGGFCGLWGGYLADRFGRRRILVWSILLYTVSALSAGLATRMETLLLFRALCFAGVCVEFIAAVAWLAELFPDPKVREAVLGYTQLFSSLGGALVAGAFYLANRFGSELPAIYGGHSAWRYTLISGLAPAIPLMLIRPFLPESPQWQQRRARRNAQEAERRGTLSPGVSPQHHRHRPAVRLRLWSRVRNRAAIAADCWRASRSPPASDLRTGPGDRWRPDHAGIRRIGRPIRHREPRPTDRQPSERC